VGIRFGQCLPSLLPSCQLIRQVEVIPRVRRIGFCRALQQRLNFVPQLRFELFDVAMG
jgi:hypothetical protein